MSDAVERVEQMLAEGETDVRPDGLITMTVGQLKAALAEYPDDVPVTMDTAEGVVYSLASTYAQRYNESGIGAEQVHYAPGAESTRRDRVILSVEEPSEGDWR